MQQRLDRFILNIPRLFLKQYPYAWFPAAVLWTWPPSLSIIFLLIIIIGSLAVRWQASAWMRYIRSEYAAGDGKFYIDRPTVPWGRAARNIAILMIASGLIASFLKGQFGLSFWQFFLIIFLFTLTYRSSQFFGATVIYIITASGIAVYFAPGHLDYRLFFTFKEISRIERTRFEKDKGWDFFARTRDVGTDGLLLIPKDPNGFSKRLQRLFIVPQDMERFLEQLPYGFAVSTRSND
jgi:hypothetical protein